MPDVKRTKQIAPLFQSTNRNGQATLNRQHTFEVFDAQPVTSARLGGIASGVAQTANAMIFPETGFEYAAIGTQTILAPVVTANGLNINMDQTDDDGVEITQGILSNSRRAFTIGTSAAFFFRVKFKITTVAGTDGCAVGFRKTQAYAAALATYTDKACINVISGDIKLQTLLNNAGGVITDTTQNWADAATHTLQVNVSAAGVVTYLIDDVAPTVTAAFTFDDGDVVVPFMFFINAAGVAGAVEVSEWECGTLGNES